MKVVTESNEQFLVRILANNNKLKAEDKLRLTNLQKENDLFKNKLEAIQEVLISLAVKCTEYNVSDSIAEKIDSIEYILKCDVAIPLNKNHPNQK